MPPTLGRPPEGVGEGKATGYRVRLVHTDKGVCVSCPGLFGCRSQGKAEAEALENIRDAVRDYLATAEGLSREKEACYVDVV